MLSTLKRRYRVNRSPLLVPIPSHIVPVGPFPNEAMPVTGLGGL
jgi:hypothetical protein